MKKILIGGCGGTPSEGVVRSLLRSDKKEEIIGMGSEAMDLAQSSAIRKYIIPYANDSDYPKQLLKILFKERPGLVHFQNDLEIFKASSLREEIMASGAKLFMPSHEVIKVCVNKFESYKIWIRSGIKVAKNLFIRDKSDLKTAFETLADNDGNIWLRSASIGGGGKGALPTNNYDLANAWIDRHMGWGAFIAAEILQPQTVTWLSIWYEGELVVAQTRLRKGWIHGSRTLSGVTGVTSVGETISDGIVDSVAMNAIKAIDPRPHGIFGVDMAYDSNGFPNPTEINISRFFTTILFFTEAGLNMPVIFKDIALYNEFPVLERKINPLPVGLLWLRGMDREPLLTTQLQIKEGVKQL